LEAWKGEPFSHEGEFYRFKNAAVSPRPYPPLRMAATTEETFLKVRSLGLPIFVGLRGLDIDDLRIHLGAYRQAWRQAGHPGEGDVCLRIPIYAGTTAVAALEEPRESISFYFNRQADLERGGVGRAGAAPAERLQARVDTLAGLSYEETLRKRVAFGTAPALIDRLGQLREELGLSGIAAELNAGGLLSAVQIERTLRILTQEVMPAFK
jgi:alkanesulfonate monooxygenase SsuD/methylene tetrahydromethanopterin reductase-like flavin-dependent oxidoreductase (luciferase family)